MLFRQLRRYFFTNLNIQPQTISEPFVVFPEEQDKYKAYVAAEHYKEGMDFLKQGKNLLALQFFKQVKDSLEKNQLTNSKPWIDVTRRIIHTNLVLKYHDDAESAIEDIIRLLVRQSANSAVIYSAYNDLFTHCLKFNLSKALLLGKALLSEKERVNIPIGFQKQFLYYLGTAYLMAENYADAKFTLRECLSQEPTNLLRGWALNSLALASWWHKHPNLRDFGNDDEEDDEFGSSSFYSKEKIDEDFADVIPLFRKAIYYIGNGQEVKPSLSWLLDDHFIVERINEYMQSGPMSHVTCGKAMLNMSEFVFNLGKNSKQEQQFWFKFALKFYENQDPERMDRSLMLLAWLCSTSQHGQKHYQKAETLYRLALQMNQNQDSYNKVVCTQLLGSMISKMPDREAEGQQLITRAIQMAEYLPYWSNRLVHVIVPDFEI